jgi:hypothetical protein
MTESTLITYEHLVCKLGGEELPKNNLRELRIEKRINDHVRVYLTGVVADDKKDQYLEMTETDTEITVTSGKAGKDTVMFNGVVTNIGIKSVRDIYYFEIEGASHTYNLDIAKEYRSFQDDKMSYRNFIEAVLGNAPALCNKVAVKDELLEQLILQYHETKWEFLKRRASQPPFHTGLVADATGKKAQFWFGIPEGVERNLNAQGFHFQARKKIAAYRDSVANHHNGAGERDFVEYELVTDAFYNIGDTVNFKDQKLRVSRATATMSGGILKFDCVLTTEAGLKQNLIYNRQLTGVSIEGKVIAVEKDNLKVSLVGIGEKNQAEATACWFPYATPYTAAGNTGWYCLPELGDAIQLIFPTVREENAFALSAVRRRERSGERLQDPAVKYFRTVNGAAETETIPKEWLFNQEKQRLTLNGKEDMTLMIQVDEQQGVTISSDRELAITAKRDLTFEAGAKLSITAGDTIQLNCQNSQITMNDLIAIDGTKINREM